MKELIKALRYYCSTLADYDKRQNFIVKRVDELITEKGFTPQQATVTAVAEDPGLPRSPELEIDPSDFLQKLALEISVDKQIDPFDALLLAQQRQPRLAKLVEIEERSFGVFREACRRAGERLGTDADDYTDVGVIELIIFKAGEVTLESANKGWPEESTLEPGEAIPEREAK